MLSLVRTRKTLKSCQKTQRQGHIPLRAKNHQHTQLKIQLSDTNTKGTRWNECRSTDSEVMPGVLSTGLQLHIKQAWRLSPLPAFSSLAMKNMPKRAELSPWHGSSGRIHVPLHAGLLTSICIPISWPQKWSVLCSLTHGKGSPSLNSHSTCVFKSISLASDTVLEWPIKSIRYSRLLSGQPGECKGHSVLMTMSSQDCHLEKGLHFSTWIRG